MLEINVSARAMGKVIRLSLFTFQLPERHRLVVDAEETA
jgi:hypothetical protein